MQLQLGSSRRWETNFAASMRTSKPFGWRHHALTFGNLPALHRAVGEWSLSVYT